MPRRLSLPLCLLLVLCAAPAASAADPLPLKPKNDTGPLETERLSNERTLTRWAHTNLLGKVRSKPSTRGKTVAKLRWNTEDELPEVYVVLESRLDDDERVWLKIRIPGRPNGRTGWVREEKLSNLKVGRDAPHDRPLASCAATLRKRGKKVWSSPVGVGAPGTVTPKGRFWIRERLAQPRRQPDLRPVGVRHVGLLRHADRLARRRRRGHPRHQPARADPRPPVARLRARAEREDQPAREAHADRHADHDQVGAVGPLTGRGFRPLGEHAEGNLALWASVPLVGREVGVPVAERRNAVQNARLADSSSSASSMFGT